ncbi:MAG: DUF4004 family protein [Lachnospiraceae bacterium]|nr:DUF4004 family protein [Lachnospiraceae bacterium]
MEEHLISKKELLQRYRISYGALYRWKRMGLIPEEWFLKKSTETGQETFFNEETICQRIDQIIAAKDIDSLQRLSENLKQQKAEETVLVIDTVYGQQRLRLQDIQKIGLSDGTDLTDLIADLIAGTKRGK